MNTESSLKKEFKSLTNKPVRYTIPKPWGHIFVEVSWKELDFPTVDVVGVKVDKKSTGYKDLVSSFGKEYANMLMLVYQENIATDLPEFLFKTKEYKDFCKRISDYCKSAENIDCYWEGN